MPRGNQDEGWEQGWDGHQEQQLRRLAELSLGEKLVWLEEAHRLVRQLSAAAAVSTRNISLRNAD